MQNNPKRYDLVSYPIIYCPINSYKCIVTLNLFQGLSQPEKTRFRTQFGMSAPESVRGRRGGSPLQAYALRPVTERNCVAARRGGEQREVNNQSVG
jgi:hypothetical protein